MNNKIIPKIIHQIWIGNNSRPALWMDTWQIDYIKKYPEWKYMLWGDKELDQLNMINKDLYNAEPTLYGKADIARYEILYLYGGVFIDADSVWINDNNLDDIINLGKDTGFIVAYETEKKNLIANGTIFANKNNDLMLGLIYTLRNTYHKRQNLEAYQVTGPELMTTICKLNQDKITVLPHSYFYPIFWDNISDIQIHKKYNFPKNVYMFQYGYSTSKLKDKVNYYMQNIYGKDNPVPMVESFGINIINIGCIFILMLIIILIFIFYLKSKKII